jgi:hypothetical protein
MFFSGISFPHASKYTIRAVFDFFRKFAEIFAAQGAPVANGKKSSIKNVLIILFGHLWEVELTNRYIFVQVHFKVSAA